MSRTTQFIGLSQEATQFLKVHNAKILCGYTMTHGMFEEEIYGNIYETEHKYDYYGSEMIDKHTCVEVVQAEPWSSGPCIFTCLMDLGSLKRIGEWSDKEINQWT